MIIAFRQATIKMHLLLSGYLDPLGIGTVNFVMSAVDVQADSGYNQHFFVETHSETDTASVSPS